MPMTNAERQARHRERLNHPRRPLLSDADVLAEAVRVLTRLLGSAPIGAGPFPDGLGMKGVSVALHFTLEDAQDLWPRVLQPCIRQLAVNLPDGPQLIGILWTAYLHRDNLHIDVVTERDPAKVFEAFAQAD